MAKKDREKQVTNPVSLISLVDKTSPISEQYRTIRTNIQFASAGNRDIKTLVVTSSGPGEGKSTTAANLAVVFANAGQRVLLVDADMRKPTVDKTFSLTNKQGLSNMLSSKPPINELLQGTVVTNLFIMTSGPKPPNPSELLGSTRMDELMQEVRALFDIVIFDMPPVVAVTDAQVVSSRADGTLLVVREGVTSKDVAIKAKQLLELSKAHILGVIYNGSKNNDDKAYAYYYGKQ